MDEQQYYKDLEQSAGLVSHYSVPTTTHDTGPMLRTVQSDRHTLQVEFSRSKRKSFKTPLGVETSEVLLAESEAYHTEGGVLAPDDSPPAGPDEDDLKHGPAPLTRVELYRLVASAAIGNTLEWYDFMMYAYMGSTISKLFFPPNNETLALMSYYGIFAVSFVTRPLGAYVFGTVGDRFGRKVALMWSIMFMAIPTALVGALPTYDQAGWTGPILLVILRAIQGFAVGGEYTTTMVFMAENSPIHRRFLLGSISPFTTGLGVLLGSLVAICFTWTMSPATLQLYGWRIPFFLSLVGAAFGIWVRQKLKEPESYMAVVEAQHKAAKEKKELARLAGKPPLSARWSRFWSKFAAQRLEYLDFCQRAAVVFMLDWVVGVAFYTCFSYMPTFFGTKIGVGSRMGLLLTTVNNLSFLAVSATSGWLYDWWLSPKLAMSAAASVLLASSYPLWAWMAHNPDSVAIAWFTQLVLASCTGLYMSATPALFVFNFPPRWRCRGVAVPHNLCMAVFGGTAPLINESLITGTNNLAMPAVWVMISAGASLLTTLLTVPLHAGDPCPRLIKISRK